MVKPWLLPVVLVVIAPPASGATFTASSATALRQALSSADVTPEPDIIELAAGDYVFSDATCCSSADSPFLVGRGSYALHIQSGVTLRGPTTGVAVLRRDPAVPELGLIAIEPTHPPLQVTLENLELRDGAQSDGPQGAGTGAAIVMNTAQAGTTLALHNTRFLNHRGTVISQPWGGCPPGGDRQPLRGQPEPRKLRGRQRPRTDLAHDLSQQHRQLCPLDPGPPRPERRGG